MLRLETATVNRYKESNDTARQKDKMALRVLGQAKCGDAEDEFLSVKFWVTVTGL